MARVAKSAKAYQVFRGGLNDLSKNPWIQNLGNGCCEVAPVIDQDRLNPTINPENSLVHTRPYGNRDYWQFSEMSDSDRARVVKHLNDNGVGAQLEVLVLPTFSLLSTVAIVPTSPQSTLSGKQRALMSSSVTCSRIFSSRASELGTGQSPAKPQF
jgi:hypothetical protein